MNYRTNAQGAVMASTDGLIWTKLPPRIDRRMKRDWSRFRFTLWNALIVFNIAAVLLPVHFA